MKLIYIYIIALFAPAMCSKSNIIPTFFKEGDVKWNANDKVFIMFRHAEKQSGDDPLLTAVGEKRAERLAEIAGSIDEFSIYSSDTKRTKATVAPLAEKSNKRIEVYNARKIPEFASKLLETADGINFISGHSNTTPKLANTLCNCNVFPAIDESDYSNIYVVVFSGNIMNTYLLKY